MALLFNSSRNPHVDVNWKVIYYNYYSLIWILLIKHRKQAAIQLLNKVINLKIALIGLIVNLAVNYYSYIDTLSITFLKIALIVYLFTNWSLLFVYQLVFLLKIALLRNTTISARNRLILSQQSSLSCELRPCTIRLITFFNHPSFFKARQIIVRETLRLRL